MYARQSERLTASAMPSAKESGCPIPFLSTSSTSLCSIGLCSSLDTTMLRSMFLTGVCERELDNVYRGRSLNLTGKDMKSWATTVLGNISLASASSRSTLS